MTVTTPRPQEDTLRVVRALNRRIPGRREQAVGRHHLDDGPRLYLIHTATGQVGPALDPAGWSGEVTLNATESLDTEVRKSDLAGIERRWYQPQWGGLLLTYSRGGVETPRIAGPITGWGTETRTSIALEAAGLRAALADLVLGTNLSVANRSLGHIMWLLAAQAQIKPGGGLPIVDGSPDPGGRGHQRNYRRWDIANGGIDKRMTELSEVIGGPDVMLRPRWTDDTHRFIEWAVMHGTSASPAIHSDVIHDFDTTAPRSAVGKIEVKTETQPLLSRVWGVGSGEGEGTLIARAEDRTLVDAGFLFKESVLTRSSATADDDSTGAGDGDARHFPVALSVPNGQVDAPRKATARIPLWLKTSVKRWRLHIENRNPHLAGGAPRTAHVKFGDLWKGANWHNGGAGGPEKVVDIRDIDAGSHETVTDWTDTQLDGNICLSFDYETTAAPHALYGGCWVRTGVREAGRQGYRGMRFTTAVPFHVWIEVEVESGTQAIAIMGSSSAAGFGSSTPLFDSPLSWAARDAGFIPIHYSTPGDRLSHWTDPNHQKWSTYKGVDKADKLLMWHGSNDIFAGANLAAMQSRFETVTDLAVRRLAYEIEAATISPRTNATGATEDTRRAFNAWLPTAPIVRETWDLAASISNDDETIRPEYNTDGLHLNTNGYRANANALAGIAPVGDDTPLGMKLQSRELREATEGELAGRIDATDQITVTVQADDPQHGMDCFEVGDPAVVTVEGWLAVPDGPHETRIVKAKYEDNGTITIDFQTEAWI